MPTTIRMLVFTLLLAGGCVGSKQARDVKFSGFLEDYSILEEGDEWGESLHFYWNEAVDFNDYDAILLEPIQLWRSDEEKEVGLSDEDAVLLLNKFYTLLYESLAHDYEMVEEPEPGAMRIEIALIAASNEVVILDLASTVQPMAVATSFALDFATGKPAFVGEATIEYRYTDAETGALIEAGVDRRVGGKRIDKGFDSWNDVIAAFEYWAELARYDLCLLRGDDGCIKPHE